MSTTVYIPDNNRDAELSQGIKEAGKAIGDSMIKKAKDDRMEKILKGISAAPDHKTGAQIIAASANGADPDELSTYFKALDELHPKDQDSLVEGKVYSPVTGAETPFWAHQNQVDQLKNPKFISEITGLDEGSFSLTKPTKVLEYLDPSSGNAIGTFVPGMQPKGTISTDDYQRDRQQKADIRSENQFAITEQNMITNDRRATETERHNSQMENLAASRESRQGFDNSTDKAEKQKSIEITRLQKYLVIKYGGRVLTDGSLDLSSLDEPRRQKFIAEFDAGSALINDGTAINFGAAIRELNKREKNEYLEALAKAKGDTSKQRAITDRARKNGVVK